MLNKPDTRTNAHDCTYMKYLKQSNSQRQETGPWLLGADREREKERNCSMDIEIQSGKMKKFLRSAIQ